jgi:phosphoribosyl-ATP pyrophosphohydrolase/phosphoribosyl-AMP cyclohydrolase
MLDLRKLDFEKKGGIVTVVTQDARSGVVLMVAHADRKALELTIETGEMHYRSRSRGLWRKGETSGNTQKVVSLAADCDGDAVLARVIPAGPACHTGEVSCFGATALAADALAELDRTLAARVAALEASHAGRPGPVPVETGGRPSYTQRLLGDRNLRLKKIGEETAELVAACADGDRARALEEGVDLLYHALVALRGVGVTLEDLRAVVAERARK